MEHGGVERLKTDHNNAAAAIHNRSKRSRRINRALAVIAVSAGIVFGLAEKDSKNPAATAAGAASAFVALGTVAAAAGDDVLLRKRCRQVVNDYAESRDFAGAPSERIVVSIEDGDLRETQEPDEKADSSPVLLRDPYGRLAGPAVHVGMAVGTTFLVDAQTNPLATHVSLVAGDMLAGGMIATGLGTIFMRNSDLIAQEQSYIRQLENIDSPGSISI